MMFLTEESGKAIGALISVTGLSAEVEITMDSIVIKLGTKAPAKKTPRSVEEREPRIKEPRIKKARRVRRVTPGEKISFDGESLTIKEWAEKLGITESGVSYRIKKHGNPLGANSPRPSDSDKVVAGGR